MSIVHHHDAWLARAIETESVPEIERWLDRGAALDRRVDGVLPLHRAVIVQSIDAVLQLLLAGADPAAVDERGATALDIAATFDDVGIVGALLLCGAPREGRGDEGYTPLMAAVGRSPQIVTLMIVSGADVNALNDAGQTPLDIAAGLSDWRSVEAIQAAGGRRSTRRRPSSRS